MRNSRHVPDYLVSVYTLQTLRSFIFVLRTHHEVKWGYIFDGKKCCRTFRLYFFWRLLCRSLYDVAALLGGISRKQDLLYTFNAMGTMSSQCLLRLANWWPTRARKRPSLPHGFTLRLAAPPYCCPGVYIASFSCDRSSSGLWLTVADHYVFGFAECLFAIRFGNCRAGLGMRFSSAIWIDAKFIAVRSRLLNNLSPWQLGPNT